MKKLSKEEIGKLGIYGYIVAMTSLINSSNL